MKYVTSLDRFTAGDYPMVCARSGRPATKMVRVQVYRRSIWRWYKVPGADIVFARLFGDRHSPWGRLPFADGQVRGVTATYSRRTGVTLRGVHRDFVAAARSAPTRPQRRPAEPG